MRRIEIDLDHPKGFRHGRIKIGRDKFEGEDLMSNDDNEARIWFEIAAGLEPEKVEVQHEQPLPDGGELDMTKSDTREASPI